MHQDSKILIVPLKRCHLLFYRAIFSLQKGLSYEKEVNLFNKKRQILKYHWKTLHQDEVILTKKTLGGQDAQKNEKF
jgi:hypothetical protein